MPPYAQNPDRVSPPVVAGGLAGVILAGVVRALIDRYVNPADAEVYWNVFQTAIVPALPAIGAFIGARFKARNDVTPVKPGDQPRAQDGTPLQPSGHTPSTGYPPR